ncbi:sulfatase-like hydrolase/transferase [candidate division KSB1 bacterium]|nr:sulfatase-like hydrolase/transferase [candidate division KSB1 bacterium]
MTRKLNRRTFLKYSGIGLSAFAAGAVNLTCDKEAGEKPNIVIFVADDAGWKDVGYHGSEIHTPVIDLLAEEGVELDQFYVSPTCSPTRASLLTGRYPSRFGILGPIAMRSTQALPKDAPTLAEWFHQHGYETAITGKWHLGLRPEVGPNQYGFDHAYGSLHGQIDQYTHRYKNGDKSWHRNGEFIDEEGHATDLIADEAIRFIKNIRAKTKPFLLYVPFTVPHYPLQEEEKWIEPYNNKIENESRKTFAASMTHMDDAMGRILNTLDELKIADNTIVIFMSDNGGQKQWNPSFEYDLKHGPNDMLGNNSPLRGWKTDLYEGGIRVPAIIHWKGKLGSKKVNEVISVNDLFPTLASIAGIGTPDGAKIEGMNLESVLKQNEYLSKRVLYWRTRNQVALRKGDWKLIHNGETPVAGTSELYNLADDPYEEYDLANENMQIVEELKKEMVNQFEMDAENKA